MTTDPPIANNQVHLRFSEMLTVTVEIDGGKDLDVRTRPAQWTSSPGWKVKSDQPPTIRKLDTGQIWRQTFQLDPVATGDQQVQLEPLRYREGDGPWQQHDWPMFTVKITTLLADPDLKSLREHPTVEEPVRLPTSGFSRRRSLVWQLPRSCS